MIRLNGRPIDTIETPFQFRIYKNDSEKSLERRIAALDNSLPRYIVYLNNKSPRDCLEAFKKNQDYDLQFWNILQAFRKVYTEDALGEPQEVYVNGVKQIIKVNVPENYLNFVGWIRNYLISINAPQKVEEIGSSYYFNPYMAFVAEKCVERTYLGNSSGLSLEFQSISPELEREFNQYFITEQKEAKFQYIKNQLQNLIETNIREVQKTDKQLRYLETVVVTEKEVKVLVTPIRCDKETIKAEYKVLQSVIDFEGDKHSYIFDKIKLNDYLHTVIFKDYFKLTNNDNVLTSIIVNFEISDYIRCFMLIDNIKVEVFLKFVEQTETNYIIEAIFKSVKHSLKDKVLETLEQSLVNIIDKNNKQVKLTDITCSFEYTKLVIEPTLLSDFIMNDEYASIKLSINESFNTSSDKSYLRIKFESTEGTVRFILINQKFNLNTVNKITNNNTKIRELFGDLNHKEPYVQIRVVQSPSTLAVEELKEFLYKVIENFIRSNSDYMILYEKYIPNYMDEVQRFTKSYQENKKEGRLYLKDVAPDIFMSDFNRNCQRPPRILGKDEVPNSKFQTLIFPRDPKDHLDSNGEPPNQYTFICDEYEKKEKTIYPGLKKNSQENKNQFPLLPCCYKEDQTNKKRFLNYYNPDRSRVQGEEEEEDEIEKDQFRFITTNKFVYDFYKADINKELNRLLTLCTFSEKKEVYITKRIGLKKSNCSFFHCAIYMMQHIPELKDKSKQVNYEILDSKDSQSIQNELNRLRQLYFDNEESACLCKQECYDKSIDQIRNGLLNGYFDPYLYIRAVEDLIQTKIYVFYQDVKNGPIKLMVPRYINGRFEQVKYDRNVIFYTHMGGEFDSNQYPQTEIFCHFKDTSSDMKKSKKQPESITSKDLYFENNQAIIKKCLEPMYNELLEGYIYNDSSNFTNKKLSNVNKLEFKVFQNIISQSFDSFGKTRCFDVKYKDKILSIRMFNLQPLKVRHKIDDIKITDFDTAMNFAIDLSNEHNIEFNHIIQNDKREVIALSFVYDDEYEFIINVHPIRLQEERSELTVKNYKRPLIYDQTLDVSYFTKFTDFKIIENGIEEHVKYLFSKYVKDNNLKWTDIDKNINLFIQNSNNIQVSKNVNYDKYKKFTLFSELPTYIDLDNEKIIKNLKYILKFTYLRNSKELQTFYTRKTIKKEYNGVYDFKTEINDNVLICRGFSQYINIINNITSKYDEIYNIVHDIRNIITIKNVNMGRFLQDPNICENMIYLVKDQIYSSRENAMNKVFNWQNINNNASKDRFQQYIFTIKDNKYYYFNTNTKINEDDIQNRCNIFGFLRLDANNDVTQSYIPLMPMFPI